MRTRRDLLPNLAVAWRVALAVLPALAVWLLPLPDAVLVVAASVVYFAVLIAVRGVPPEVWAALRSR
jgi:hypothetical protein